MKSLQEWESLLSGKDLPVLDETLQLLRALSRKMGTVSGGEISGTVLPDPLMTLKVMRMANSGRRSRFAQEVTTIEHALMMLGMTASFDKMLGAEALSTALPPHAQAGLERTVARALHAADQARDWAVLRLDLNVDEVLIAAMLQELGEFALWTEIPDEMQLLETARLRSGREVAEQRLLGFRCDELGLLLSRKWNLPPLVASAFLPAECEAHPRARLVAAARNLSRLAEHGWYDAGINQLAAEVAGTLHLQTDDILARLHRVAAESARMRTTPASVPAAAWLPMLPGPWPEADVQQAGHHAASAQQDNLPAILDEIARHQDGTLTLHGLMQLVLRGMEKIGLERVVFGLLTPDKSELKAKYIVGANEGAALKRFRFRMDAPHLLSRLLARQQAFWLNAATRQQIAAMLDPAMTELLAEEYFIMSVAVHGRIIGLFYADRGNTRAALNADAYADFKTLCTRAAEAMAHLAKSK